MYNVAAGRELDRLTSRAQTAADPVVGDGRDDGVESTGDTEGSNQSPLSPDK